MTRNLRGNRQYIDMQVPQVPVIFVLPIEYKNCTRQHLSPKYPELYVGPPLSVAVLQNTPKSFSISGLQSRPFLALYLHPSLICLQWLLCSTCAPLLSHVRPSACAPPPLSPHRRRAYRSQSRACYWGSLRNSSDSSPLTSVR